MEESKYTINVQELITRLLKYLFEGIVLALAIFLLPVNSHIAWTDGVMIAVTGMAALSLVDALAPSMSQSVRLGAGATIGSQLAGGISTADKKYKYPWDR